MQSYPEIKRFVQQTLGCTCPEEVFEKIDYQKEGDGIPGRKVTVGDRLLIYIITMDSKSGIQGVIDSALESIAALRGCFRSSAAWLKRYAANSTCNP